jgi:NTE family protein
MEDNKFPREISLCLSGGAARGAFHLGAISVLEKHNIKIKAISGSSIGAIIGASLACGKKAKDILQILKSKEFKKVFKLSLGNGYVFKIDKESKVIDDLISYNDFNELSIPLIVATCDVDNAKALYYDSGKLKDVLLASSSVAPLLEPIKINNKLHADGGLVDNFPVEVLKQFPYKIVGINLYPNVKGDPMSIFTWIKRIVFVSWQAHNLQKQNLCDIYLSCDELSKIKTFSFKDLDKAYELGIEKMSEIIKI